MNVKSFFRVTTAITLMLTVNFSAQAQLGGALKKAADAAKKEVIKETPKETPKETSTSSSSVTTGSTAQPAAAATSQQPWVVDKEGRGRIHATYANGVLTFKGYGEMKNFTVSLLLNGEIRDDRPWAAYVKEIKSVVVEEEITHLGNHAFHSCENLTSVSLPGTLVNIQGAAFWVCKSLTSITLPKSLTAFSGGEVTNPENPARNMQAGLFGQCTSLTEIKVADGNEKFKSVNGVLYFNLSTKWRLAAYPAGRKDATFNVPDQTPVIMVGAFSYCKALKTIVLPATCSEIQQVAFMGCTGLESITMKHPTGAVKLSDQVFRDVDMSKVKIYVPKGILENYTTRADSDWREWKDQIIGQ